MRVEANKDAENAASPHPAANLPLPRRRRLRSVTRDGPEPVDVHVGARIRLRRTLMGLSQSELGKALGLTFQQVQKYERGANRVSASTLHRMAGILDVPVSFFFDDLPDDLKLPPPVGHDAPLYRRESLELLRSYHAIPDPIRKQVYELIKALKREDGNGCG
ncbi:MAG TPA: helix-turn-helix transcriptional regulator [Azospirillum sp.]|nr:helix-turn-helix transcriptional regulator [Azospirillum sp.]